jgi:hypothetical protein
MTPEVTVTTSSRIELAAGKITPSGDSLQVELIQPGGSPPAVLITWPAAPSVTNTDPRGLATVAAAVVRVLAEAQARLTKIRRQQG